MNASDININADVATDAFYAGDLEQMRRATNYLRWQNRIIFPFLGKHVLEIGSGIGNLTVPLAEKSGTVLAIEPNQHCYARLLEATRWHSNVKCLNIFSEHLHNHLPPVGRFDTLVSTNVFEHILDDRNVLLAALPFLRDRAKIILQVPAGNWAYGEMDRLLGHYRRYDKPMMRSLFSSVPGHFIKLRYYNPLGMIGWWVNTKIKKISRQSDRQIWIFDKLILPPQALVERVVRFPFGQTIFAVFEYTKQP
ncbi:MAG: methyltransferase domain-containing protein [Opitutaceae bacterium]|jgi:SAM-dependent methyltransferase|nr:methyltransferase domain-containing protein [Opitutaceae bacterium]